MGEEIKPKHIVEWVQNQKKELKRRDYKPVAVIMSSDQFNIIQDSDHPDIEQEPDKSWNIRVLDLPVYKISELNKINVRVLVEEEARYEFPGDP